jgi:dTDP-4-dehydrorhamnose reductase
VTRWLVTGAGGMLGHDVAAVLADREVTCLTRTELDVTDEAAVVGALQGHDVVVNTAAWTDVDGAEAREVEATRVNGDGPRILAQACAAAGARLVHVSTDYVFAGQASSPYREDAPLEPISAYGRSKAAGELAVREFHPDGSYIVRTSWLYGAHGPSFVQTMLALEAKRDTLDVVDDQRGAPTWSMDVARSIVGLVEAGAPVGTYHATSSGETTWFGLARAVFELLGADPDRIRAVTSDQFPRPAPRPAYSVLGHDRWSATLAEPPGEWRSALRSAVRANGWLRTG